jgi:hypothetical protein
MGQRRQGKMRLGFVERIDTETVAETVIVPRAADVVELHRELTELWSKDTPLTRAMVMQGRYSVGPAMLPEEGELTRRWFHGTLQEAELYWVSPDMVTLLRAIAPSMPEVNPEPPVPSALVIFAKPVPGSDAVSKQSIATAAILWGGVMVQEVDCLCLETFGWKSYLWPEGATPEEVQEFRSLMPVRLVRTGGHEWAWHAKTSDFGALDARHGRWHVGPRMGASQGETVTLVDRPEAFTETQKESMLEDRRLLAAFWALAKQRITIERREPPIRQVRRRLQRAGLPVKDIRVITLREASSSGHNPEPGRVEWSHRWVVGGHWRQQPWGPENRYRRATWIAPFVKGPSDKPLVVRPTVRSLQR